MIDPRLKIQDPRNQYPKPPFPKQPQPPPGLAARMAPKPDHGETSYKGSGKLVGRKALVTGADSGSAAQPPSLSPVRALTSPSCIFRARRKMLARSSS
jgi:hypothetical protein